MSTDMRDDLTRYLRASEALTRTADEEEELGRSEAVETYRSQMDLVGGVREEQVLQGIRERGGSTDRA